MNGYVLILVAIFGAVIGSFLNVCIHRIPKGESIVWPPSHCPGCDRKLTPFENIPILSYLFLLGKCKGCGMRISPRYPLIEMLTVLTGIGLYTVAPNMIWFGVYWFFLCVLTVIIFIDIEHLIVPDVLSLPGIAAGFVCSVLSLTSGEFGFSLEHMLDSILGILAGGGCIFIMGTVGEMIFKKEAVGGGDLKLMAMIGAFLGWKLALVTFFLAPVIGSIFSINILLSKKQDTTIPYAPYLCVSAVISLFFGYRIIGYLFPVF